MIRMQTVCVRTWWSVAAKPLQLLDPAHETDWNINDDELVCDLLRATRERNIFFQSRFESSRCIVHLMCPALISEKTKQEGNFRRYIHKQSSSEDTTFDPEIHQTPNTYCINAAWRGFWKAECKRTDLRAKHVRCVRTITPTTRTRATRNTGEMIFRGRSLESKLNMLFNTSTIS